VRTGRDTDGYGVFTIDPLTGIMRTRSVLDHEERSVYRIAVAATDNGIPPKQTVRVLRVEILDVNDNRPTFSSSSLIFKVSYFTFYIELSGLEPYYVAISVCRYLILSLRETERKNERVQTPYTKERKGSIIILRYFRYKIAFKS